MSAEIIDIEKTLIILAVLLHRLLNSIEGWKCVPEKLNTVFTFR